MPIVNIFKGLTIAWLSLLLSACAQGGDTGTTTTDLLPAGVTSPDFEQFYALFHSDSTFQVEHIAWPLDGNLRPGPTGELIDEHWHPESWIMHKPLELGDQYVREIEAGSSDLVVERVKTASGSYIIERRFAKFGDQWMLIYYRQAEMG